MTDQKKAHLIEVIKNALMVEIKGQQLYSHAATQTQDPSAKILFEMLANDEEQHVNILKQQYESLMKDGALNMDNIHPAEVDHGSQGVVSDEFKKSIKRGDFEMAVIGIGCDLEAKAIAFYEKHAAETDNPELKKLFTWLVEWEEGHLDQLKELEDRYQAAYWADQGFSPM